MKFALGLIIVLFASALVIFSAKSRSLYETSNLNLEQLALNSRHVRATCESSKLSSEFHGENLRPPNVSITHPALSQSIADIEFPLNELKEYEVFLNCGKATYRISPKLAHGERSTEKIDTLQKLAAYRPPQMNVFLSILENDRHSDASVSQAEQLVKQLGFQILERSSLQTTKSWLKKELMEDGLVMHVQRNSEVNSFPMAYYQSELWKLEWEGNHSHFFIDLLFSKNSDSNAAHKISFEPIEFSTNEIRQALTSRAKYEKGVPLTFFTMGYFPDSLIEKWMAAAPEQSTNSPLVFATELPLIEDSPAELSQAIELPLRFIKSFDQSESVSELLRTLNLSSNQKSTSGSERQISKDLAKHLPADFAVYSNAQEDFKDLFDPGFQLSFDVERL